MDNIQESKNRINILLINPPFKLNKSVYYAVPPLGLLYLCSSLKSANFNTTIYDFAKQKYTLEQIVHEVVEQNPTHIGFSVMTDKVLVSLEIANAIKSCNPEIQIFFGGPHINATEEELMTMEIGRNVDFSFIKESESTLQKFFSGKESNMIEGLCYRDTNGNVVKNASVVPDFDVNTLPYPNLQDVSNLGDGYRSPFFKGQKIMTMMTSRGVHLLVASAMFIQVWVKNIA